MERFSLILLIFLFLIFSGSICAEDSPPADKQVYKEYIAKFAKEKNKSSEELTISTAKYFLGKPYVASTLEVSDDERLTVNLREFDCTTFVENCIVLSEVIKSEDYSYDNYEKLLQAMRYRNGLVDGYISRLHYTSDWIYENQKRGVLKNISREIGGKSVSKSINFMSRNSQLYKHLKNNLQNVEMLKIVEKDIAERHAYEILPLDRISQNQDKIKDGDIVVFATSVDGLDYSHIGLAYWKGSELHFIHASSKYKKVIIENKTLLEYCQSSKNCTGVSILRMDR